MSITREQIRELAEFEDSNSCAVSFYFQPSTPRNKAHKEDTILIKDLAREALHRLEQQRRLTDARVPTEQDEGAGHHAAPQHTVELTQAGAPARFSTSSRCSSAMASACAYSTAVAARSVAAADRAMTRLSPSRAVR